MSNAITELEWGGAREPGTGDPPETLTVLLADGDAETRVHIRAALERDGFDVLAEARDASEALEAAMQYHPQLCVLAADLPGDGLLASRQIFVTLPGTRIAVLTEAMADDQAFEAIRCGADGYLGKDATGERLGAALRAIARGEPALPRALTAHFVHELRESPRAQLSEKHGAFNRTVFYVPRFIRHLRHRLRSNMRFGVAWQSARLRMREYR